MKVIFLDIDGVLVNRASFRLPRVQCSQYKHTAATAHPKCVEALNRITTTTGAVFILSSVWRMFKMPFMKEWLKTCGVKGTLAGMTPELRETSAGGITIQQDRGHEIQAWLDSQNGNVESFVILDDDSDMAHLRSRLVQTKFEHGLTEQDATRALTLLVDTTG